jgi:MFS family permease
VGAWSGLAGVATAIGPLVGGWMVELWSWRLIFLVNLPLAVVVLVAAVRYLPETRDPGPAPRLDHLGAALAAVGLGAITATLTALGGGALSPTMFLVGLLGVAAIAGFVVVERRSSHPMVPPAIFRSRQFTGANLVTLVVYGVLGGAFFVLTLQLQVVLGYSAVGAGAAELPITVLMLLLSARAGALAERIGPRLPMTIGPIIVAAGLLLLSGIDADSSYLTGVLPGVFVLGLGLSATVAPLTATLLAAVDPSLVGVASGVNNAVARAAGLLTVAALPAVAGLTGDALETPAVFNEGFVVAMQVTAVLAVLGGLVAWLTISNRLADAESSCPSSKLDARFHCSLDGTPPASPADAARVRAS